jgi:hypothetical protein
MAAWFLGLVADLNGTKPPTVWCCDAVPNDVAAATVRRIAIVIVITVWAAITIPVRVPIACVGASES